MIFKESSSNKRWGKGSEFILFSLTKADGKGIQ